MVRCFCHYQIGVRLTEQVTDRYLVEEVRERCTENKETFEEARTRLVASFCGGGAAAGSGGGDQATNSEGELQETALRASLLDPLLLTRMKTPVRGTQCSHAQCFDLAAYIAFQRTYVRFECPVCAQRVLLDDLMIDPYFERVLRDVPASVDTICILPDGNFQPLHMFESQSPRSSRRRSSNLGSDQGGARKRRKAASGQSGSAADANGGGDANDNDDDGDDDDDDDDDDDVFAKLKAQMMRQGSVIDLT